MNTSKPHFTFLVNGEPLANRVVIVTGVNRSGTTLTGNLVGSLARVEYEFEPFLLTHLPILESEGLMDSRIASEMLQSYANELLNSRILGRGVNMRSFDDTYIGNYLSEKELHYRWNDLITREDVIREVSQRQAILGMKMANLLPFFGFINQTFPNGKILHIIRHPFDVALSVQKKRWFSNENLQFVAGVSLRKLDEKQKRWYPWWVNEKDIDQFFRYSELERALYCWQNLWENGFSAIDHFRLKESKNYMEIYYEELLEDPNKEMKEIARFLETEVTEKTQKLISTIKREKLQARAELDLSSVNSDLLVKVEKVMKRLGYSLSKLQRSKSVALKSNGE